MMHDPQALSKRPRQDPLLEADYDSICAAMMETARGRWFLGQYAQRNRNADTQRVLAAIDRIERVIGGETPAPVQEMIRAQLLAMAEIIGQTREDRAALAADDALVDDAGARVQKMIAALRDLDDQIAVMLGAWSATGPAQSASATQIPQPEAAGAARIATLALVEVPAPVAPVPRPQPRAFAPEPEPDAEFEPLFPDRLLAAMQEPPQDQQPAAETAAAAAQAPATGPELPVFTETFTEQLRAAFARAVEMPTPTGPAIRAPAPAADSALAALMTLSEEERIALFS